MRTHTVIKISRESTDFQAGQKKKKKKWLEGTGNGEWFGVFWVVTGWSWGEDAFCGLNFGLIPKEAPGFSLSLGRWAEQMWW